MSLFHIKYREDQPRLPSGVFGAGRWTSGGTTIPLRGTTQHDPRKRTRVTELPERGRLIQQIRYSDRVLCVYDTSIGKLVGEGSIFGCQSKPFISELFHYRLLNDNVKKP